MLLQKDMSTQQGMHTDVYLGQNVEHGRLGTTCKDSSSKRLEVVHQHDKEIDTHQGLLDPSLAT